jgi:3-dehydroquinate synthase
MGKITDSEDNFIKLKFVDFDNFDFIEFNTKLKFYSKIVIIVDSNTIKYCYPRIKQIPLLKVAEVIEIKSGEQSKSIDNVIGIWKNFSDFKLDRNSLVINLGGGMICDLGGFAASTYKRGIDFINIPTTLLSMVDAAIGGKTGINFLGFKNQIGVFKNPNFILIDIKFLKTLPYREFLSGYAEVIKHSLIIDPILWELLKNNNPKDNNIDYEIIKRAVLVKHNIVITDPKEKNIRKILNFGHTIGHAFESYSLNNDAHPLTHGEAVAMGIICELYLSVVFNGFQKILADDITKFILSLYPYYELKTEAIPKLLDIILQDKKNKNGNFNFTLLSDIGKSVIDNNVSVMLIEECLIYYINLNQVDRN